MSLSQNHYIYYMRFVFIITPTTPSKFVPWVSGSWSFCQTRPGLHDWQPRLCLIEDSRTTDFQLGLLYLLEMEQWALDYYEHIKQISWVGKKTCSLGSRELIFQIYEGQATKWAVAAILFSTKVLFGGDLDIRCRMTVKP